MNIEYFLGETKVEGFSYPDSYVSFAEDETVDAIKPWWLIGSSKGLFDAAYNFLNVDLESNIILIPFSKNQRTGAFACFDLDGRVYLYVGEKTLKDIDWKRRFSFNDFNDWLLKVIEQK
ncbi:MAG: hypothetical protein JXR04_07060 [Bermanella sp.]